MLQTRPVDRHTVFMRTIDDAETQLDKGSVGVVAERIVRFGFLPLMLFGVNGLGWWLAGRAAPKWLIVVVVVGAVAVSFAAERVLPYRRDWNNPLGDAGRDVAHGVVNETLQIGSLLMLPLMVDVFAIDGVWPNRLPFAVQVLLAIVVVDAGITFGHRISHEVALLWRFHAVHHSVKRFYGFNGLMKHPIHQLFETALGTAPLVVLGLPSDVATAIVVAVSVQLLLQHSNTDYFVPSAARWLLALNHAHRFHHLKWAGLGDVNFGLFTNVWDRMMGTAVWDPERQFSSEVIGTAKEPDFPDSYRKQLIKPFECESSEPSRRREICEEQMI